MPVALILAFFASLGLHAAALFGPEVDLSTEPEPPVLHAELRPLSMARPEPVLSRAQPGKRTRQKVLRPNDSVMPGAASVLTAPESEEVRPLPAPEAAVEPEPMTLPYLPEVGQIRYRVERGDNGFEIGRATSEWEVVDGAYVLRLHTETTGIVWLFKRYRIDMESQGRLTAEGLQPERFSIHRNGVPSNEKASFDWQQMKIRVGDGEPQALAAGAQDLLSFNFHLGFMQDPRVARTLPIATGKKYGTYRLEAVGDEMVDLPVGPVRTLHLRAPGVNTTELWLAYDYLLLPVKIRHEDNKGDSFVQVATDIRLGRVDGE